MTDPTILTKKELIEILEEMINKSNKTRFGFMESEFHYTCGDTLKTYIELLCDKLDEVELRNE